ncbi:MAG TPA: DR2241 family protein [Candidatus Udaeobacter sp.]
MQTSVERTLGAFPFYLGEILVRQTDNSAVLCHRDDTAKDGLEVFRKPEDAIEIAKYDDAGNYRPLKTAPNLRHGWRMKLATPEELDRALDHFYPGRLAVLIAWQTGRLRAIPLRETLERQSGMYRAAARISAAQINDLVGDFCRSNGGCLRAILWKRDERGAIASTKLPTQKFDPTWDQVQASCEPGASQLPKARANNTIPAAVPLLCQEACNLLVAACREVVKAE